MNDVKSVYPSMITPKPDCNSSRLKGGVLPQDVNSNLPREYLTERQNC